MPAIYPYPVFARSGGFISYGVDLADLYRRAEDAGITQVMVRPWFGQDTRTAGAEAYRPAIEKFAEPADPQPSYIYLIRSDEQDLPRYNS